ncbi:MAG: tRNA dihydrouridine synthase DusB [Chlamydiia bacterium]
MTTKTLIKKLRYGPRLELPHNILYAPLAGCTDVPMRQMAARHHPALMFCEMLKMDALVRRHPHTLAMANYTEAMRPIGAQLVGSKPEIAGEAAKVVEELGFDSIDLNCGCPVDKVTKDGSGSGLLKNPDKIGEILVNMVAAVSVPVTVKVRLGWDDESVCVERLVEVAEASGAVAITIHGRTREQGYSGSARWDEIRRAKECAKNIYVIGNGDVFTPQDAERMLLETGVDGVLVARGTMGQPWICQEMLAWMEGSPWVVKTSLDRVAALREHFDLACAYFPERKALLDLRRFGAWYLKGASRMRQFRHALNGIETIAQAHELLNEVERELILRGDEVESGEALPCSCEG